MPGCCIAAIVMFLSVRLGLIIVWIFTPWYHCFQSTLVAFLGWVFAPWTSLAYIAICHHNAARIEGVWLAVLVVAILMDASMLFARNKKKE